MKNQERPKGIKEKGIEIKSLKHAKAWFRERIYQNIKDKVSGLRRREMVTRALVFSKSNADSLMIMGDPKRDLIIMAYNNEFMVTDIKSKFLHMNQQIIKKNLTKDFKGLTEEQINYTRAEFNNIFKTLLFNFIEIINNKQEKEIKVAEKDNTIKK